MLRGNDSVVRRGGFAFGGVAGIAALSAISIVTSLAGCGSNTPSPAAAPAASVAPATSAADAKTYHLDGVIVSVDKEQQRVMVNHKEIPGFMGAMTMPYPVAVSDSKMLDTLKPGDHINADVAVDDTGARLQNITVVGKDGKPAAALPKATEPGRGAPGDFAMLNQDGRQVRLASYRGKAVLLTFIYTRCPLPDYCPLMTHNFSVIEKSLSRQPALYSRTHLLSISFDPQFDTPEVLRNYAAKYGQARFGHWEFAALPADELRRVASDFDLLVTSDSGQISHSLCTAIVSPDGSLYKIYPDNDWKPAQVLADLTAAAALPAAERS